MQTFTEAPAIVGYRIATAHVCSDCAPGYFTEHGSGILKDGDTITAIREGDDATMLDQEECIEAGMLQGTESGSTLSVTEECDECSAILREYEMDNANHESGLWIL